MSIKRKFYVLKWVWTELDLVSLSQVWIILLLRLLSNAFRYSCFLREIFCLHTLLLIFWASEVILKAFVSFYRAVYFGIQNMGFVISNFFDDNILLKSWDYSFRKCLAKNEEFMCYNLSSSFSLRKKMYSCDKEIINF